MFVDRHLIGAPFVVWRVIIASRQNAIALENVRNTLFSKAVEQLGTTRERKVRLLPNNDEVGPSAVTEPNIEVRLGAIYALEKLAREDVNLHWPIMETLCAFVRENAGPARTPPGPLPKSKSSADQASHADEQKLYEAGLTSPSVDVLAALSVLGRRSETPRTYEDKKRASASNQGMWRLDLRNCQLPRLDLSGLDFRNANFSIATSLAWILESLGYLLDNFYLVGSNARHLLAPVCSV